VGPALVSAGLEYQRQAYRPGAPVETLTGYVAASSYQSFGWHIRTTFDYQLLPDVKARLLSVTVDRRLSDRWSLRVAAGQPLDRLDGWNLALSSIYATRAGDLALTGEYDNRGHDWRLLAQWSFGVGYAPGLGYRIMRSGPGSGGAAVFDAFIDANGDGVRQLDEAGAPNVAVQGGAPREALTGPDGRAYVGGLGPGPTAALDVSLQRADNTAVSTPPSRIDLRPRPGAVARIPYPMRPTGEVLVRAELLRDDGKTVGLASVRLQLVPASGQPIEAVTEFDGSAIFEAVPVAAYQLRLDPRQAEKLRMRLVESPTVAIAADGAFTPDVVVHVRFEPAGGA